MQVIGLTGGIASGKSTIAHRLVELGARHLDADVVAREVVEVGSPALERIRAEFGDDVLDKTGALRRAVLGDRVFADHAALERLNSIVHPVIEETMAEQLRRESLLAPPAIVVEAALMAEAARRPHFDFIVVARAPHDVRLRRLIELRGYSHLQALGRLGAQADDAARLAIADEVIDTSGLLDQTREQVDDLWRRRIRGR